MGLCWRRILLILHRELLDQLRDRRTLFAVLVLPMLLYPLLGIALLQMAVLFAEQPRFVAVVGAENLPEEPPLIADGSFDRRAVPISDYARLVIPRRMTLEEAERALPGGEVVAIVVFREPVVQAVQAGRPAQVELRYRSSDEASELVAERVRDILQHWQQQLVEMLVRKQGLTEAVARPLELVTTDLAAGTAAARTRLWGRLVPFLIVLMMATGTFYPAVDLIAGEKERGTLETILVSAATRLEIVLGKLFAVTLFGVVSGVAHLASVALTTGVVVRRFAGSTAAAEAVGLSAPEPLALVLTLLATVPVAIGLGAVSTLLASLARSVKEAQYYLTPYFAVLLLLVAATLSPGIDLSWRTAVLPFTGHTLLLRSLLQAEYGQAWIGLVSLAVTIVITVAATALSVRAFYSEAILNREAEQGPLWHAIVRYRSHHAVPGLGLIVAIYGGMLTAQWFLSALLPAELVSVIPVQIFAVLGLPVAAAWIATGRPLWSLRLRRARLLTYLGVCLLFVGLHPLVFELAELQQRAWGELPPAFEQLEQSIRSGQVSPLLLLVTLALVPAVCEEVAFRGWILTGLQSRLPAGWAVLVSALLFAFFHANPLQFPTAFVLGCVLGAVAVLSNSIWPCVLGHALHNGLVVLAARFGTVQATPAGWLRLFWADGGYRPTALLVGAGLAVCGLGMIWRARWAGDRGRDREVEADEAS